MKLSQLSFYLKNSLKMDSTKFSSLKTQSILFFTQFMKRMTGRPVAVFSEWMKNRDSLYCIVVIILGFHTCRWEHGGSGSDWALQRGCGGAWQPCSVLIKAKTTILWVWAMASLSFTSPPSACATALPLHKDLTWSRLIPCPSGPLTDTMLNHYCRILCRKWTQKRVLKLLSNLIWKMTTRLTFYFSSTYHVWHSFQYLSQH